MFYELSIGKPFKALTVNRTEEAPQQVSPSLALSIPEVNKDHTCSGKVNSYYGVLEDEESNEREEPVEKTPSPVSAVEKEIVKESPPPLPLLSDEDQLWQNQLMPLLPDSVLIQAKVAAPPGDTSYGALTSKSLRDAYSYQLTSEAVSAANLVGKLPSQTLLTLLLYNTPKEIAAMSLSCKMVYQVCGEGLLWRSLLARYYPDCRVVPRGLAAAWHCPSGSTVSPSPSSSSSSPSGSWRDVWLLEANNIRYQELCCSVSKTGFDREVLGLPLDWTVNPKTGKIDYINSSMELLGQVAVSAGMRKTPCDEEMKGWLPIFLTQQHFHAALDPLKESLIRLAPLVGMTGSHRFDPLVVLEVLPRMMKTIIVLLVDNGVEDIDSALRGYCMLHRLFIALVKEFPQLQREVLRRLQLFQTQPNSRSKQECPDMGNLMPLLSVCDQLGWVDLSPALLGESFARQVLWSCRDVPELARIRRVIVRQGSRPGSRPSSSGSSTDLDSNQRSLLQKLFESSAIRRRLFSFHCCFLRLTAGPRGCNLEATAAMYDRTLGLPSKHMVNTMRNLLTACQEVRTWPGFFRSVCMTPPSPLQLYNLWADSVQTSLRCRYHTSRTDFSKIQSRGVSSFLMRGESYSRIVFCIDISGSMATGVPGAYAAGREGDRRQRPLSRMEVVQQQIEDILTNRLTHRQQFTIVAFNHEVVVWGHEGPHLLQATKTNIDAAIKLVRSRAFVPSGGTNIMDALRTAFGISNVQAVYLISDGEDSGVSLDEVQELSDGGRIKCHATAFCSSRDGKALLEAIAAVSGGSFASFDQVPEEEDDPLTTAL